MGSNAACRVAAAPLYGFGSLVVLADVAHELSPQIRDGGEDASSNDVPFDLGEPKFDLVEPGRVSLPSYCRRRRPPCYRRLLQPTSMWRSSPGRTTLLDLQLPELGDLARGWCQVEGGHNSMGRRK